MEIRQLKAFHTVAAMMSFTRAADHLNYAQSSISAQVQSLEEELKVKLFDRLGRRIVLTEAGERLLNYAQKIISLEQETRDEVGATRDPRGSLTIRIPETVGVHYLPGIVRRFHSSFPKVQLNFTTCAHEGLEQDLRKGVTDLAFLLTESIQAADLNAESLSFETLILVAPPGHRLSRKKKVLNQDLRGETFLFSKVDCSYRQMFQNIMVQEEVLIGASLEFNSVATIKSCVREGVGLSVLPAVTVMEDIAQGRMHALDWEPGNLEVALLMVWFRERWISPSLKAFMGMTRDMIAYHK